MSDPCAVVKDCMAYFPTIEGDMYEGALYAWRPKRAKQFIALKLLEMLQPCVTTSPSACCPCQTNIVCAIRNPIVSASSLQYLAFR